MHNNPIATDTRVKIPEYFTHKSFKSFFKRIRHLGWTVKFIYVEDNSLNLPPFEYREEIKFKTLKYEFWENNAMHHYCINGKYSIDIPSDAERIYTGCVSGFTFPKDCYGYYWRNGPTNYIFFYKRGL